MSGPVRSTLARIESRLDDLGGLLDEINGSLDRIEARLRRLRATTEVAVIYDLFVFATLAIVVAAWRL